MDILSLQESPARYPVKGKHQVAAQRYRRVCLWDPSRLKASFMYGTSLARQELAEKASPWLRRSFQLSTPPAVEHYIRYGLCLGMQGRLTDAIGIIEEGLRTHESSQALVYFVAQIRHCREQAQQQWGVDPERIQSFLSRTPQDEGRYLVCFVRASTDLDHLAAVVWRWTTRDRHSALVVCVGAELVPEDYRLRFFESLPRVLTVGLGDVLNEKEDTNPFAAMIARLVPLASRTTFTADGTQRFLYRQISRLCRNRRIPFVALPHGEAAIINTMRRVNHLSREEAREPSDNSIYDLHIYSNEFYRETASGTVKFGLYNKKITLGSTRYCGQWLSKLAEIRPVSPMANATGQLQVVFFLTNPVYAIWWEEVYRTTRMLAGRGDVNVIIQEHPNHQLTQRQRTEFANVEIVSPNTPGTSLIAFADVFLSLGTSIVLEAIRRGKPVLELSFAHANRTLVAANLPETDMRCRDDVMDWMDQFTEVGPGVDLSKRFYTGSGRARFIATFLEAGNRPVLEDYVDQLALWGDNGSIGSGSTLNSPTLALF